MPRIASSFAALYYTAPKHLRLFCPVLQCTIFLDQLWRCTVSGHCTVLHIQCSAVLHCSTTLQYCSAVLQCSTAVQYCTAGHHNVPASLTVHCAGKAAWVEMFMTELGIMFGPSNAAGINVSSSALHSRLCSGNCVETVWKQCGNSVHVLKVDF